MKHLVSFYKRGDWVRITSPYIEGGSKVRQITYVHKNGTTVNVDGERWGMYHLQRVTKEGKPIKQMRSNALHARQKVWVLAQVVVECNNGDVIVRRSRDTTGGDWRVDRNKVRLLGMRQKKRMVRTKVDWNAIKKGCSILLSVS